MVCLDFRRVAPVTVISGPSSVSPDSRALPDNSVAVRLV